jgi:hypothetical protein
MCLTVAGEEEGCCGVIHGGIPHGGDCPPGGGQQPVSLAQQWGRSAGFLTYRWPVPETRTLRQRRSVSS